MLAKKVAIWALLASIALSRFKYRNENEFINNRKTKPKKFEHVTYTVPLASDRYWLRKERDEKTVVAICSHSMADTTDD